MKYRMIGTTNPRKVSVLSLGAMLFGTATDEATSFAILDRYVEAGGTFIDTANNYAFWADRSQGGHSERLLGKWRRSRGVDGEVVIATKLGGRPARPGLDFAETARWENIEGLSAKAIRESADRSRTDLGVDELDLLYAHVEDPTTPLEETVSAFADLVADGTVGMLGASNHWAWRLERARALAAVKGLAGYEVVQYQHSYLRPRTDLPSRRSGDGNLGPADGSLLSYLRAEQSLALVAYSPLLSGAYVRADKPLPPTYDHPGTPKRLAALREVAAEIGATVNQVVLAWLIGSDIPTIPLVGASSVQQLNESLAAVEIDLTPAQRTKLDQAG